MTVMERYHAFLASKSQDGRMEGFAPIWMPDFLFGFQAALEFQDEPETEDLAARGIDT